MFRSMIRDVQKPIQAAQVRSFFASFGNRSLKLTNRAYACNISPGIIVMWSVQKIKVYFRNSYMGIAYLYFRGSIHSIFDMEFLKAQSPFVLFVFSFTVYFLTNRVSNRRQCAIPIMKKIKGDQSHFLIFKTSNTRNAIDREIIPGCKPLIQLTKDRQR